MIVSVNDKPLNVHEKATIIRLLEQLSLSTVRGIAVAKNQHVVSKKDWPETKIEENDHITIITATQGG